MKLKLGLIVLILSGVGHLLAAEEKPFRPPAVPLVVVDPYFSTWSTADHLYDEWTKHWTGANHAMAGMIRVDGRTRRFMGTPVPEMPPVEQLELTVHPTRTVYRFGADGVELRLTFLTPALPDDLDILSRPVTYLNFDVHSTDGKPHEVSLYFDISAEWVVNTVEQEVVWDREELPGERPLSVMRLGSKEQPVLQKKGDNLRIDWGYLYLTVPQEEGVTTVVTGADGARGSFAEQGSIPAADDTRMPRAAQDEWPVMICRFDLGRVEAQPVSRHLTLAYDDLYSIEYFHKHLRPYWRRNGMDAKRLLTISEQEFPELTARCKAFDEAFWKGLTAAGGERYARLCALLFRQILGANKLVADTDGTPLYFSKENFSNGCIATVDVTYPSGPFFVQYNTTLLKGELIPVFVYARSDAWKFPFAPHDLGTYPKANGQVYGDNKLEYQMPVEESGNMLILTAAVCRKEGNAEFAAKYWDKLTEWAEYLRDNGLDPTNQLCTADMFGHLPHNADLSLKAIVGLGGYAMLCEMLGKTDDAKRYRAIAEDYAAKWQEMASEDGHTRLAFDQPGTWGMKHNLVWDRVLGLNLFPNSVGDGEVSLYLGIQNEFGLPCDNRTPTCLIDWCVWCASLARNNEDFKELIAPLYRYANETPSRVPLSDWFNTLDSKQRAMQARSVVGGVYMRLLAPAEPDAPRVKPHGQELRQVKLPPIEPLFDYPVRDTSICIGGDGNYYLTGTTGHPTWWKTNEGIRVWKSADLKHWELLGLVWKIEDGTWQKKMHGDARALWAPDIHYLKGTFWLTYSMNFGGCGLLKSTTGKAEGPYIDVHPDEPITGNIDASLFQDDDGTVYFVWQNGLIARMNDQMTDLAEPPRHLKPTGAKQVGFEGAYVTKKDGRYYLICADFIAGDYHCMVAASENLHGPYGPRYQAIPHGGHNMFFTDKQGNWQATFFGNDPRAPFRERPAILRIELDEAGHVRPVVK